MNELWIVRFVRKDGKPDEEYYYRSLAEAEHHKNLFLDDDSGLYEEITTSPTFNCKTRISVLESGG